MVRDMSPISSRKMVPLWAWVNEPRALCVAPVKEPFVAEELALEQGFGDGGAIQCDEGAVLLLLAIWIALATSSLPVPLSPWMKTVESLSAIRATTSSTRCILSLFGDDVPKLYFSPRKVFNR